MPGLLKPALAPDVTLPETPDDRYHRVVMTLHWLTLVLIALVYTFIEIKGYFPKGSETRDLMQHWHEFFGLSVFALVIPRLALRRLFFNETPRITPEPPHWQRVMAHTMHGVLYAFLIVMPLLGWLTVSAKGQLDLPLGLHLMPLISPDKPTAHIIQDIHETIGNIGLYLIGLHAAAALLHHYWMRDNTLQRMLPKRWTRKS